MSHRKTQIEKAIAVLESEIEFRQHAIAVLRAQQDKPKPEKPRKARKGRESDVPSPMNETH